MDGSNGAKSMLVDGVVSLHEAMRTATFPGYEIMVKEFPDTYNVKLQVHLGRSWGDDYRPEATSPRSANNYQQSVMSALVNAKTNVS